MKKQSYLEKNGGEKDANFKQIDEKIQQKISEAKNTSFQEFASELDHQNRNKDVYRAMKNVGSRRPSRITELTIKGKGGIIVTNTKEKSNLLSLRYQTPLGYHPNKNKDRKRFLKKEDLNLKNKIQEEKNKYHS